MGRNPCYAKEGMNRGAWTAMEDKILTDYIKTHGEGKWRNLSKKAGLKRCGKSCRLRWVNYLRPDVKRGNITDDEEELIVRLHKLLGNRWSLIAGRLPGRTDNDIQNFWNTKIRKKLQNLKKEPCLNSNNSCQEKQIIPTIHNPKNQPIDEDSRCDKEVTSANEPGINIDHQQQRQQIINELKVTPPPLAHVSMDDILQWTPTENPVFELTNDFEIGEHFLSDFLGPNFLELTNFDTRASSDTSTCDVEHIVSDSPYQTLGLLGDTTNNSISVCPSVASLMDPSEFDCLQDGKERDLHLV